MYKMNCCTIVTRQHLLTLVAKKALFKKNRNTVL